MAFPLLLEAITAICPDDALSNAGGGEAGGMVLEVIQRPTNTNTMSPPEETLVDTFIYVHLVLTLAGGGEEAGQHGAGGDRAADAGDDGGDGRRHLRQAGRRRDCRPRLPRLWRRRHHRCAVGWAAACKTTTPMPNTFLPPWFTHRRRLAPGGWHNCLAWLPGSPDVTPDCLQVHAHREMIVWTTC